MIGYLAGTAVIGALLSGIVALQADRLQRLMRMAVFPLLGLAGLAATVAGSAALISGQTYRAEIPLGLPWLHWQVRMDGLAGFLFFLIGIVVLAISIYGPGYAREYEHSRDPLSTLGGFTGLFIASMMLVVLADDAFMFMMAWEMMSLSSYFLVAYQHEHSANRRAAFLYLLMAHIGGLSILLGYGVLASHGGSFTFDAMRSAEVPTLWTSIAFALAFFGFGMKAGLLPVHAWLPEAHPVAPSHISALMSGVMLKVAVYGFIRFSFDLLGDIQWGWGVVVLTIGSVSALMGILSALLQRDIKRLLAYSSVENIGIIFMGLGLSLIFLGTGNTNLGVLGLIASLYHTLNHALFKSLLFLGAGSILHATHEQNLEHMGGLLNRMPWTGLFFLIGSISISALPPFNGFVSEWLTFQAALQIWALEDGVLRALIPISAAVLALTGALAAATFVKTYGVAFLGQARSRHVRKAREVTKGMRIGQGMLALLCLLFGVLPTMTLEVMNAIPDQLLGAGLENATLHGWLWLTPVSAETASYSAPLVLLAMVLAGWLAITILKRSHASASRRGDPWDCGFSTPDARMQYTATAFSQPFKRVLGLVFRVDKQIDRDGTAIRYQLNIADRLWGWFYEPVGRLIMHTARRVSIIQSGSIRNYLGWTLGTLLVLLWVIS